MNARTWLLWVAFVSPSLGFAQEQVAAPAPPPLSPFERPFGIGAYATGWHGAYGGAGVGARLRYEALPFLGLDLFGEALLVQAPHGVRHDHPIGFNLFVPFRLGAVRLRPLLGMCVTLSFLHPEEPGAPSANTVLVGAHVGGGVELALASRLSVFAEGKAVVWVGNDRTVQGWTGAVGNAVRPFVVGQAQLGLLVHLGGS
jgi:hypothetical protein